MRPLEKGRPCKLKAMPNEKQDGKAFQLYASRKAALQDFGKT